MADKDRKLTPAEEARRTRFETLSRDLEAAGYERTDLTVGLAFANIAAVFLMLPFAAALWISFFTVNGSAGGALDLGWALLFLVLLLLLTAVHEGIHGLTWGLFAENRFRAVSFGVIWKYLSPYCTCGEPLRRWQYVLGTAMPTLILGFGLGTASVLLGLPLLLLLAEIMLFSGGGDALIILKVLCRRTGGGQVLCCDHPYEGGAVLFEKP